MLQHIIMQQLYVLENPATTGVSGYDDQRGSRVVHEVWALHPNRAMPVVHVRPQGGRESEGKEQTIL